MKKWLLSAIAAAVLGGMAGCSSTPEKPEANAPTEPVSEAEKQAGAHGGLPVRENGQGGVEVLPIDQQETAEADGLAPDEMNAGEQSQQQAALAYPPVVYFAFDSDVVSEEGRQVLKYYADRLLSQPDIRVRLEGHTDERGSPEYNLALGERRAKAVKEVLVLFGVDPSRIEVISYGEARPAVDGHDEAAWAKNRRVELVFVK